MQRYLSKLLSETLELFKNEKAIVNINSENAMIVGDLHGNFEALEFLLNFRTKTECKDMIFLGDYVDKGEESVDVLSRLLELKLEEPENITLLRGNHETIEVNRSHGFYEEIQDEELF
ncbi:MAG: metallophosphoesterase family protein [Methanolobus sp.]